jgi:sugar lactone lactonase YvrE
MMRKTVLAIAAAILSALSPVAGLAHPGTGIVVTRRGEIYFADVLRDTIWKVDAQGKLTAALADHHTHNISMDRDGNLYGETVEVGLWVLTPQGKMTTLIENYYGPLAVDAESNLYFTRESFFVSEVRRRTPDGKEAVFVGGSRGLTDGKGGAATLSFVGGMAWGLDGVMYFTDGTTVRKATKDGTVTTLARGIVAQDPADDPARGSLSSRLKGVAGDVQGNVYVADYGNRRVLKIAPDGKLTTFVTSERPWSPAGVAFAGDELYVLEYGDGHRVRKITSDGKATIIATVEAGSTKASDDESARAGVLAAGLLRGAVDLMLGVIALMLFAWRMPVLSVVFLLALAWIVWRRRFKYSNLTSQILP